MSAGKVTMVSAITVAVVTVTTLFAYFDLFVPFVSADNVSTSVTVLNTPPSWTVNAHESTESSTSTPTNAGTTLSFNATATDSSNDNYYLLICSNGNAPTANSGAAPTCGSGALRWAVSGATASGAEATAATTTLDKALTGSLPFDAESNVWYAWICDGNTSGPQCNALYTQGDNGFPSGWSPFVINHAPLFFTISNSGNTDPGGSVTWTGNATDTDQIRGGDILTLKVCKAADLSGGYCGSGGTWATSTANQRVDTHSTTTPIYIPTQDRLYNAFTYIVDQSLLGARQGTTSLQGFNSSYSVNNVAPSVSGSTVSLVNPATATTTGEIILTRPFATSGPFNVQFQVTDNNSCLNSSSGNEISSATTSVYRSSIVGGASSCQISSHYNPNSCHPSVQTVDVRDKIVCSQDGGSCSGASDTTSTWTCVFNLWYIADPTDTGSVYAADNWQGHVQVSDDNGLLSPATTTATGTEVDSLLAFDVSTTSIAYGGLQPGNATTPFVQTTDLQGQGNTGLDESVYGDTMCTSWTSADSCDAGGIASSSEIAVWNQQLATTSQAFQLSGGVSYPDNIVVFGLRSSTTPRLVNIGVLKTTATNTPQSKNTFWGINVPSSITVSGNYSGQNTIIGVRSAPAYW